MKSRLPKILLAIAALIAASLACNALGGPLLSDNFEGDSNWGVGTDADSSVEYDGGGLRMQLFRENYFVWSTPNEEEYENIHIEVIVKNNGTDSTTAFGIICDQQHPITDSFYYLVMTPGGEYVIAEAALALDDVFLTEDEQWGFSDAIAQDADSYRVGADCGNGKLTLYVDGQAILSVSDSTYTSGGVGLLTWSGEEVPSADVTFDDFTVTKLEQ